MYVYTGEAKFLEKNVLCDVLHSDRFTRALTPCVAGGGNDLNVLVKEPLPFWMLAMKELNICFNRRLTDTSIVNHIASTNDLELQEIICDAADVGPTDLPAPETRAIKQSGCTRVAYRCKWMDTAIAMQDLWWRHSSDSVERFASLLDVLRAIEQLEDAFLSHAALLEAATDQLLTSFIATPVVRAPGVLKVSRPTDATTA